MQISTMFAAVGLVAAASVATAGVQSQTGQGDRYQGHDGPNIDGYRRDIGGGDLRRHTPGPRCHAERRRHHTRACR